MARVLHLLTRADPPLALETIRRDAEAGDEVTLALIGVEPDASLPAAIRVHRVPAEWTYEDLLEQIFAADRVVTW